MLCRHGAIRRATLLESPFAAHDAPLALRVGSAGGSSSSAGKTTAAATTHASDRHGKSVDPSMTFSPADGRAALHARIMRRLALALGEPPHPYMI